MLNLIKKNYDKLLKLIVKTNGLLFWITVHCKWGYSLSERINRSKYFMKQISTENKNSQSLSLSVLTANFQVNLG